MITGFPESAGSPGLEPIGVRLHRYTPWLADEGVCIIRFEDVIGRAGDGDAELQRVAVERLARHVPAAIDRLSA